MLTLKKDKLSASQKLFIVFAASFLPLVVAIFCQLDVLSTLEATLLVFFSSTFFILVSKRKDSFRLD